MHTFERYLTEPEERRLFAAVGQFGDVLARRDRAWMVALRQTGVRIRAFSQLTVADAQRVLSTHYLQLRSSVQKRRQAHTVHVTRKGRAAFKVLLALRLEQGYPETPEAPLVMSRNHRPMSVRSYQARMTLWCRRAGLDVRASPHWFRHTLAKRLIAKSTSRDPLGVVQAALGHRTRNATGIYALPDRESVAQALEAAS